MNKKTILQGVLAVVFVGLFALILYFVLGNPVVDTSQVTSGYAYGINGETRQVAKEQLSSDDVSEILRIAAHAEI